MEIVVPHAIETETALRSGGNRCSPRCGSFSADEDDVARRGLRSTFGDKLRYHMRLAGIENRLRCIEAKPIEMKFSQPVLAVVDDEVARAEAIVVIEIERLAPFGFVTAAEVVRTKALEIIAVRTHVVVDHIENDGDAERVGVIDEALECIGSP